jgi:two-component system, chemotaxis family, CheB/CheR fusion protein
VLVDRTLLEDARTVLKKLAPQSKELEHRGNYLRRIAPYRTEDERIEGVVITLADITEAKRAAQQEIEATAAANARLEERVRERSEELRRLSRVLALAEVHERQTIARDLHDGVGQELNAAVIKLDALRGSIDAGKAAAGLADIATLLQRVGREMRSLTAQLNPPVLEQLGLVPAIEWLAEEMRKTYRLEVAIDEDEAPKPLNPVTASIVYRAVRELLINVARHAQVRGARVHVRRADSHLNIEVSDQGAGFALDRANQHSVAGLGLATIRERIGYVGGVFKIDSKVGRGTAGTIEVPMRLP